MATARGPDVMNLEKALFVLGTGQKKATITYHNIIFKTFLRFQIRFSNCEIFVLKKTLLPESTLDHINLCCHIVVFKANTFSKLIQIEG